MRGCSRAGLAWAYVSAAAQGIGAVMSRKAFAPTAAFHEAMDPGTAAYQRAIGGVIIAAEMKPLETSVEEVLRQAIQSEVETRVYYQKLAERAGSPSLFNSRIISCRTIICHSNEPNVH